MKCISCEKGLPILVGGPLLFSTCPFCGHPFFEKQSTPMLGGGKPPRGPEAPWMRPGKALTGDFSALEPIYCDKGNLLIRGFHRLRTWPSLIWCFPALDGEFLPHLAEKVDEIRQDGRILSPKIQGMDFEGETPFLVCDLPEGGSFHEAVATRGVLKPAVALRFYVKLCEVLEKSKSRGWSGSNVHPARVFLCPSAAISVLGIGLWFTSNLEDPASYPRLERMDIRSAARLFLGLTGASARNLLEQKDLFDPWLRALILSSIRPEDSSGPQHWEEVRRAVQLQSAPVEWLETHVRKPSPETPANSVTEDAVDSASPEAEPASSHLAETYQKEEFKQLLTLREQADDRVTVRQEKDKATQAWDRRRWMLSRGIAGAFLGVALGMVVPDLPGVWSLVQDRFRYDPAILVERNSSGFQEFKLGPAHSHRMILIPSGKAVLGISSEDRDRFLVLYGDAGKTLLEREYPEVTREVDTFYIDRTPVTNQQYREFLVQIKQTNDHSACHSREPKEKDHRPFVPAPWAESYNWTGTEFPQGREDHPVVMVDWFDAYAYANWAGLRLPTENEWERAARGNSSTMYPWGDSWREGAANCSERIAGYRIRTRNDWVEWTRDWKGQSEVFRNRNTLTRVGSFPEGASAFGVLDMAGNVWEWTTTLFDPNDIKSRDDQVGHYTRVRSSTFFVVKGGAWGSSTLDLRSPRRGKFGILTRDSDLGIRCAADG